MATNQNGHLVDDEGNVAIDFVWGNFQFSQTTSVEKTVEVFLTTP
jgi:hypothetical protein